MGKVVAAKVNAILMNHSSCQIGKVSRNEKSAKEKRPRESPKAPEEYRRGSQNMIQSVYRAYGHATKVV